MPRVGARYLIDGSERFQEAGTTVVATYAFENSRLLLLSKDKRHGRGLGNETGQVGGHYMTRQQPSVYAVFEGQRLNRFIGPTAQAMAVADLSCDHFDHDGLGFIRGGRIAAFNQYLPIEASGVLPPDVPRWGVPWRDFFLDAYNATSMLFLDPEILPYQNNRLDLDPDVADSLGRPVTRITFDIGENERRLIAFLQDRAERIAKRMGATRTWRRPPLTGPISTHDVGGTPHGRRSRACGGRRLRPRARHARPGRPRRLHFRLPAAGQSGTDHPCPGAARRRPHCRRAHRAQTVSVCR